MAEREVAVIRFSELYAGIRMDVRGPVFTLSGFIRPPRPEPVTVRRPFPHPIFLATGAPSGRQVQSHGAAARPNRTLPTSEKNYLSVPLGVAARSILTIERLQTRSFLRIPAGNK